MRLPASGELVGERQRKLVRQTRMRYSVLVHALPPRRLQVSSSLDGRSILAQYGLRHVETAVFWPSKRALRQTHLLVPQRLAVRMPCVLLVRAAISDMR